MGNFITVLDILFFLVILISAGIGYFRGLVHEIFSIISWLGASLATIYGLSPLKPYFADLIGRDNWMASAITVVILFLGTLIALSIFAPPHFTQYPIQ